ncbi:hypothetical protein F2Q69_00051637 [Brassica cretica]|uniref:Uncharacterized protein n=1 Tax=Brassica cretica TaxID=69181 RepID=A0A8S9PLL0_BRACR|nr:hypothetical protein F2Q69_00051637 [Brassica cretica]
MIIAPLYAWKGSTERIIAFTTVLKRDLELVTVLLQSVKAHISVVVIISFFLNTSMIGDIQACYDRE